MSLDTGTRRFIPLLARREGYFLESILPVRALATLTAPRQVARQRLDESFSEWIQRLQAHNRATLGWIKSSENTPQRHIHAALIAGLPLDCAHAASLWQAMVAPRYSEAAIVEPYQNGLCGLGYVLKRLDWLGEEPQFSDNILAFGPSSGKSQFRTTSAQRRQVRRIGTQLERAAHSDPGYSGVRTHSTGHGPMIYAFGENTAI